MPLIFRNIFRQDSSSNGIVEIVAYDHTIHESRALKNKGVVCLIRGTP